MAALKEKLTELTDQGDEAVRSAGQLRGELEKLRERENMGKSLI